MEQPASAGNVSMVNLPEYAPLMISIPLLVGVVVVVVVVEVVVVVVVAPPNRQGSWFGPMERTACADLAT